MSTIEQALTSWLTVLASANSSIVQQLNPPATLERIEQVEETIGQSLPEDLKALYLIANGQKNYFPRKHSTSGKYDGPLFGRYEFSSIETALVSWKNWKSIADMLDNTNEFITARLGDPIDAVYYRSSWFPFAEDGGGNAWAVDLAPIKNGTYGQIVQMGSDENERRVIAASLTELFTKASKNLKQVDLHPDKQEGVLFFEMDWTQPVLPAVEHLQLTVEEQEFIQGLNSQKNAFNTWIDIQSPTVSVGIIQLANTRFLNQQPTFQDEQYTNEHHESYNLNLAFEYLAAEKTSQNPTEAIIEFSESARLLHRWLLQTGDWTRAEYESAEAILSNYEGARDTALNKLGYEIIVPDSNSTDRGYFSYYSITPPDSKQ